MIPQTVARARTLSYLRDFMGVLTISFACAASRLLALVDQLQGLNSYLNNSNNGLVRRAAKSREREV